MPVDGLLELVQKLAHMVEQQERHMAVQDKLARKAASILRSRESACLDCVPFAPCRRIRLIASCLLASH